MKSSETKFYVYFTILNLFLSSYFIDLNNNWNSTSRALPVLTYAEKGNFAIEKYDYLTEDKAQINGKYYTDKSPITSFLVIPFYSMLRSFGLPIEGSENDLKPILLIGGVLCSSIPFTLILMLALKAFRKLKTSVSPVLLVMFSFYGSMLYVFSGTFFSHLLAGVLILVSYIELKNHRNFLLAGLLTGLAFASEFTLGTFIPLWALIIWWNEKSFKKMFLFSLGTIPSFVLILFYNYHYTGSPFLMLYNFEVNKGFADSFTKPGTIFGFAFPELKTYWEVIFGQFKGVLFYVPVLILVLLHYYKYSSQPKFNKLFKNYFFLPVLCYIFLIISKRDGWWGGWTYGPRYLIPVIIVILYEGLLLLSRGNFSKKFFFLLTGFGILCAWIAKATVVHQIPTDVPFPILEFVAHKFVLGEYNPNNIFTLIFNLKPVIAIYLWAIMFGTFSIYLSSQYKKINSPLT